MKGVFSVTELGAEGLPCESEPVLTNESYPYASQLPKVGWCLWNPSPPSLLLTTQAQWLCLLDEASHYKFLGFQFLYLLWGLGMGPSSLPLLLLLEASSPLGSLAWGHSRPEFLSPSRLPAWEA